MNDYPRDMIGYGAQPPRANWPEQARIALQFVLNYEEGGENNVLHGDAGSEQFLSEIIGSAAYPDRHMSMESIYEYGARAGFWRLWRLFRAFDIPVTVYGVTDALARSPSQVAAIWSSPLSADAMAQPTACGTCVARLPEIENTLPSLL